MTAAERQQRKRDRQKAGLVRVEVWVPSDKAEVVREAVAAIQRGEEFISLGRLDQTWVPMDTFGAVQYVPPVEDASPGPAQWMRVVSEDDYQLIRQLRGGTQARLGQSDPAPEAQGHPACET